MNIPTSDFRLPTTDYRSPITDYRLPITDFLPLTRIRYNKFMFLFSLILNKKRETLKRNRSEETRGKGERDDPPDDFSPGHRAGLHLKPAGRDTSWPVSRNFPVSIPRLQQIEYCLNRSQILARQNTRSKISRRWEIRMGLAMYSSHPALMAFSRSPCRA